jgi:hypothetical protein
MDYKRPIHIFASRVSLMEKPTQDLSGKVGGGYDA